MDVAIPLAFPDYLIAVETPQAVVRVPALLPFIDLLPERIIIKEQKSKAPYLGHAGVLFFGGQSGLSKYYEYGRYDRAATGLVRRVRIPDTAPGDDAALAKVLSAISQKSGQDGAIKGAYIELSDGAFEKMLAYSEKREKENHNPRRRATTSPATVACISLSLSVKPAGPSCRPWSIPARPGI